MSTRKGNGLRFSIGAVAAAALLFAGCEGSLDGMLNEDGTAGLPDERVVIFNGNGATKLASPGMIRTEADTVDIQEEIPAQIPDPENEGELIANPEYDASIEGPQYKTVGTQIVYSIKMLPTPPEKINHVFTGWNTQKDGRGSEYSVGTLLTKKSITVYAQWSPDTGNQLQFTGREVEYRFNHPGYYMLELWGGQGWTPVNKPEFGGKGAYTRGVFEVSDSDIAENSDFKSLYVFVAGTTDSAEGSFNGAGRNWTGPGSNANEGGGGGASDARWGGRTIYDRIIVAAGGGGANDQAKTGHGGNVGVNFYKGGYGGVFEGGSSNESENQDDPGIGAAGIAGGKGNVGTSKPINQTGQGSVHDGVQYYYQGSFYQGGSYLGVGESAGAGGGGYWGGYSGGQSNHNGGGGGGSSYISGLPGFIAIAGNGNTAPRSGSDAVDGTGYITVTKEELIFNPLTGEPVWETDEEGNPIDYNTEESEYDEHIPEYHQVKVNHITHIYRGTTEKATHYSGKKFIPKLVLFVGESGLEKEYTSEAIGGNTSMPRPDGATEIGHFGAGYGRITFLGDGIIHEIIEPEYADIDEETPEDTATEEL